MKRYTGSLRRKILLVVMTATSAALLLSAVALLLYEVRSYRSSWVSDLASQADLIAQSVAPTLAFDDPKAAHQTLRSLKLRAHIRAAAVFDAAGRPFAAYQATDEAPGAPAPATLAALHGGPRFSGDELEVLQDIRHNGERLGSVYLRAEHDLRGRVVDYLWILALTTAAGLGVAALIFRQLHPAITGPILAVANASRQVMEQGNYDLRVAATSDDEVGVLVEAFNNMLHELSVEMRERHGAEEALRAADRRKDEFLATLAHELRNPLAPLANALAVLQRADDKPEVRQATRAMMERQLAQMVRLIDDLLEVSRITRGKLELRRQTVDVVAVAQSALESADPLIRKNGHAVSTALPAQAAWVDGDAARLAQVFVNLLHNAAKYTPSGGHIRVGVQVGAAQVEVLFEDNGIGIAAEHHARVFEMFTQIDNSLERGAAGLGVGLSIARQIVELHGGRIGLRSDGLGRGSCFTVSLPAAEAPAPATRAEPETPAHAAPALDVLIADDNVDFANSFGKLLRIEGHAVRVVHDGRAALEAATQAPPDVAFLDIGMPGLNGYDLAGRLRALAPTRGTRLVAVTGWGQEADRQRVRAAGFDEHLVKPIQFDQALKMLQAVPHRPSARGPATNAPPSQA